MGVSDSNSYPCGAVGAAALWRGCLPFCPVPLAWLPWRPKVIEFGLPGLTKLSARPARTWRMDFVFLQHRISQHLIFILFWEIYCFLQKHFKQNLWKHSSTTIVTYTRNVDNDVRMHRHVLLHVSILIGMLSKQYIVTYIFMQ